MPNNYMLKSTYERFLQRLQEIKTERIRLIQDLEAAAAFGDLRENAEYDTAMERQGQLNREAESIQRRITNVQFIDELKISAERVSIGTMVTVDDIKKQGLQRYYCIVGCIEDDCPRGFVKVTYGSPVAKMLIGKVEGDIVIGFGTNKPISEPAGKSMGLPMGLIVEIRKIDPNATRVDTLSV